MTVCVVSSEFTKFCSFWNISRRKEFSTFFVETPPTYGRDADASCVHSPRSVQCSVYLVSMTMLQVESPPSALEMREDCWPDCVRHGAVVADDVSRLNATRVERIFQVRNIEDIQFVIREAQTSSKRISMRGAKHSMGIGNVYLNDLLIMRILGGHTLSLGGLIIDMQFISHMSYEPGILCSGYVISY